MVDIDIRYDNANWPHFHMEPIFEERIMPLANTQFLERHCIRRPEDLVDVPLIQSTINVVPWRAWFLGRDELCNAAVCVQL